MDKKILNELVQDQAEDKKRLLKSEGMIERETVPFWRPLIKNELVKVTMGPRRAGKTTFTHQLLLDRPYAYINFDDEKLAYMTRNDLNDVLDSLYRTYGDFDSLLLDEVQNVDGWELFINRLQRKKLNMFITGSNANLLSRELATHLTGRHLKMEIFPFSFREFLTINKISQSGASTQGKARLIRALEEYMKIGGYPEVLRSPEIANFYLNSLFSSILSRDIISRNNIRLVKTFKELAYTLISNFSQMTSYNKLKSIHGLKSVHTAKNYADALSNAYLFYFIDRISFKPKEITNSPKKVYCIDPGMVRALALRADEARGRLMENVVLIELMRRKAQDKAMKVYYWRDYQDHEVDFVIKRRDRVDALYQVTYASGHDEIDAREVAGFVKGSEALRCKDLRLITWDLEDEGMKNGTKYKCIPLWKWLVGTDTS